MLSLTTLAFFQARFVGPIGFERPIWHPEYNLKLYGSFNFQLHIQTKEGKQSTKMGLSFRNKNIKMF